MIVMENMTIFYKLLGKRGLFPSHGGYLVRDRSKLSAPLSFHKGRINNPIEVMANEVEPLKKLLSTIKYLSWQPKILLKYLLIKHLLQRRNTVIPEIASKLARLRTRRKYAMVGRFCSLLIDAGPECCWCIVTWRYRQRCKSWPGISVGAVSGSTPRGCRGTAPRSRILP